MSQPLILASASPRRRELMHLLGFEFVIDAPEVDEHTGLGARDAVAALSRRKALASRAVHPDRIIVAADTLVALDDVPLGKPTDEEDAFRMLSMLSDRTHTVFTGVSIVNSDLTVDRFVESTEVHFFPLSEKQIRDYIATGEYSDKAGGYAIQGGGSVFVSGIIGDYYNVMGLPIGRLMQVIHKIH